MRLAAFDGRLLTRRRLRLRPLDRRLAFSAFAPCPLFPHLRHALWFCHPCPQILDYGSPASDFLLLLLALPGNRRSGRLLIHGLDRGDGTHI
jgi:hypothetical protein